MCSKACEAQTQGWWPRLALLGGAGGRFAVIETCISFKCSEFVWKLDTSVRSDTVWLSVKDQAPLQYILVDITCLSWFYIAVCVESEWFPNWKQTFRSNIQANLLNAEYDKSNRSVNILAVKSGGAARVHPWLFLPLCNNGLVALAEGLVSLVNSKSCMHPALLWLSHLHANLVGKKSLQTLEETCFFVSQLACDFKCSFLSSCDGVCSCTDSTKQYFWFCSVCAVHILLKVPGKKIMLRQKYLIIHLCITL